MFHIPDCLTVGQLIEKLSKYNKDLPVIYGSCSEGIFMNIEDVSSEKNENRTTTLDYPTLVVIEEKKLGFKR